MIRVAVHVVLTGRSDGFYISVSMFVRFSVIVTHCCVINYRLPFISHQLGKRLHCVRRQANK